MTETEKDTRYELDGLDAVVYSTVCMRCKRFSGTGPGDRSCEAFPGGTIPAAIWLGQDPHTSPVEGDGGKQFVPRPGVLPPEDREDQVDLEDVPDDEIEKGERIYVTPNHPAPKGVKLYRGLQGGIFYFGAKKGAAEGVLSPRQPGGGSPAPDMPPGGDRSPVTPAAPEGAREHVERAETRAAIERFARKPGRKGIETEFRNLDELRTVLSNTKYALISAGRNPKREADEPEEVFRERHERLRRDLADLGYVYTQVLGRYGDYEDSLLVMAHDADLSPLIDLGKKYNQDSIIWSKQGKNYMVYTTDSVDDSGNTIPAGSYIAGEGYEEIDPGASDYYTEVYLAETRSTARFSLNFDWSTIHPPGTLKED